MSHIERRKREKEEVKQKILDATLKIATREGWQFLTIRKIADEIEYTPPVVYEHFENKEDLIQELIHGGFRMLKKEFDIARKTENDAKQLLRKLSLINWDFASNNLALHQLMFRPERPTPTKELMAIVKTVTDTFMKLSNNKKAIAEELNINWFCLMHGAISLLMFLPPPPEFQEIKPRDLFIKMIDRFIKGI